MSKGVVFYPQVIKTKIILEHVIDFQPCTVSPQLRDANGSKDASLNFKKKGCILFCCNPLSHSKSCVHQLSSTKLICNSNSFSEAIPVPYLIVAL